MMFENKEEIQSNVTSDRSNECDFKLLADLGRHAIGTRSISDFCKETGLSQSFVSKLINGRLTSVPTKRSLYKFAGPSSHPENGITAERLLLAAGYSLSDIESEKNNHSTAKNFSGMSLADSIANYYARTPTAGLELFLNALISKGYGMNYIVSFQPGLFTIKETSPVSMLNNELVVIPAFCEDPAGMKAVKISALQRCVLALNFPREQDALYFIITNNRQMYNSLSTLSVISTMNMSILFTEDFENFKLQMILQPESDGYKPSNTKDSFPIMLT